MDCPYPNTDLSNNFVSYNGANGETGENDGNSIEDISYTEGPTGEDSSETDLFNIEYPYPNMDLSNNFVSYNEETGENDGNSIEDISYTEGPTGEESSEMNTQIKRPFYNYIKHRRILNPAFF